MNPSLLRLLHLSSAVLPVGAYSYSQAMEWAMESNWLSEEEDVLAWITDCLEFGGARFEAIYLCAMMKAWQSGDIERLVELDAEFAASRETSELLAETLQMGHSLARLLKDLGELPGVFSEHFSSPCYPLAWSAAAVSWSIPEEMAVSGYLWSWAENQVMVAVKGMPLGQTAGQRMLYALGLHLAHLSASICIIPVENALNFLPAFSIASSLHETQYTRLFKS